MWKIREIQDKVTNVVMNYTLVESKVREATNDDQWGPHGSVMAELAKYTFTYEHFPEVMGMLWKRMLEEKMYWRRVYKCLLLLNYLILNGSERVISSARDHIHDMRQLENFQHTDESGKDQGLNIRHKMKEIVEMIQDDQRLREERKRAKNTKDKYVGMASDTIEDSFYNKYGDRYSDRYNREPHGYNTNPDMKSKFQQFKESVSSMRPGRRDYSDYNTNNGQYDSYKDEPDEAENVEEAEEFHDDSDIEDNFKYKSSKEVDVSEDVEKKKKSPVRKIDLGAAANLGAFTSPSTNTSITAKEEPVAEVADFANFEVLKVTSTIDELSDVLTSPLCTPSLVPISNDTQNDLNENLFGDFSGSPPSQPQPQAAVGNNTENFANFESLESLNTPVSNTSLFDDFDSLSISGPQLQSNNINLMQPQFVMQPTNMQPTATSNVMQQNMMQPNTMQPTMSVMQSSSLVPGTITQPNVMFPQGNNLYQPMRNPLMSSNMIRYPNNSNMNKTSDTAASKSTMWSGTGVDISLDNLTPGGINRKNPMPSMNQLSGQQFQPPEQHQHQQQQGLYNMQQAIQSNMVNNNMSGMNMGVMARMPMQQQMGMMQPNMNMQMVNMGPPMMNQMQIGVGGHMHAQPLQQPQL